MTLSRYLLAVAFFALWASTAAAEPPLKLAPYFELPKELASDFGLYRSPLKFSVPGFCPS